MISKHNHNHIDNCRPSVVEIKDAYKATDICDQYGKIRYRIILDTDEHFFNDHGIVAYNIRVVDSYGEPIALFPEDEEPMISYDKVKCLFDELVKHYTMLIKAERRDHQDISLYKNKVGYIIQKIQCCATCKHSKLRKTHHDYIFGVTNKLECTCPETQLDANLRFHDPNEHNHKHFHDDMCRHLTIVHPKVSEFGKCNYWMARNDPDGKICPGESIAKVIDRKINKKIAIMTDDVNEHVDEKVNEVISNIKIDAIVANSEEDVDKTGPDGVPDGIPDGVQEEYVVIGGGEEE